MNGGSVMPGPQVLGGTYKLDNVLVASADTTVQIYSNNQGSGGAFYVYLYFSSSTNYVYVRMVTSNGVFNATGANQSIQMAFTIHALE
jgi:hypothetical protein